MANQDFILAPQTVTVTFALEPALNNLASLMLLEQINERSGFKEWVAQTVASLTPEQRRNNRLVFDGLHKSLKPESDWPSFPAYIDDLEKRDPYAMRDDAIDWMCSTEKSKHMHMEPLDRDALLSSREAYLNWVERMYQKLVEIEKESELFDPDLYTEVYELLNNPPKMQKLVAAHLRDMWDSYLASEWAHVLPMLQQSLDAFKQLDYSGSTPLEAIRAVTGRDLSGHWDMMLGGAEQIIFIPSAHIGPYVSWFETEPGVARIIFGARLPEGARVESPALSRSELLVRLSALADDTRLQILELLSHHEELYAQDIMTMLDLSQSSTSRHLRQLSATGYLIERRREVAKCYSINPARFEDTLRALKRLSRPAHKTFVNVEGKTS